MMPLDLRQRILDLIDGWTSWHIHVSGDLLSQHLRVLKALREEVALHEPMLCGGWTDEDGAHHKITTCEGDHGISTVVWPCPFLRRVAASLGVEPEGVSK